MFDGFLDFAQNLPAAPAEEPAEETPETAPAVIEEGGSVSRVYCWLDQQDQVVQILFKSDGKVDSISYQLND